MSTRVYVIEDHRVMREALVEYLEASGEVEVCGTAARASDALEGIPRVRPALILLDLSLPDAHGLELLGEIRDRWEILCIVFTGQGGRGTPPEGGLAYRTLAAGARGFLEKGRPREILRAIRRVRRGGSYFPEMLEELASSDVPESSSSSPPSGESDTGK
jgi:DNA-binding NarL/FixJ family response regulator